VYLQIGKALWLFVRELLSVVDLLSICLAVKGCWVSFAPCSSNSALKRMMYPLMCFLYPIVLLILCILTDPGLLWDPRPYECGATLLYSKRTPKVARSANPILGAEKMSIHNSFLESVSSL
jgi:hypothetical protein